MASLFRSYYRKKVNDLYDYVNSHKEDAIKIKGLLEYHQDMLSGMDQVVIKVSGELDAIFLFYVKDRRDALEKLKDSTLSPEQLHKYEEVVMADGLLLSSLSTDGINVSPFYNELYYNMKLLEKFNNKLPVEDRRDLEELYSNKRVLK